MKKLIASLLILVLVLGVSGCKKGSKELSDEEKYQAAVEKYNGGDFEDAKDAFLDISGYEDSDKYVQKAEVMSKIQGTYQSEGNVAFTINKFDVLNWDEGTTIDLQDSCNTLYFRKSAGDAKYNISFQDEKVTLICEMPLVKLVYEKME